MMSKLSRLIGSPKKVTIGGEELELKPLSIKYLDLILDLEDDNKRTDSLKKLIRETLKKAVPDASDQEIDNVSIQYFKELSEAILSVHGMDKQAQDE